MKVLVLSIIPIIAFAVGTWLAKRQNRMLKPDREELAWLRSMREELIEKASEHATLGDDFAVIALGIMRRSPFKRSGR